LHAHSNVGENRKASTFLRERAAAGDQHGDSGENSNSQEHLPN
jgi:hypothetical protein